MVRFLLLAIAASFAVSGVFIREARSDGKPADKYYQQLFADGTLNITVALSFEQIKSHIDTPVVGPIADVIVGPQRDVDNTMNDVAAIENAILTCAGCPYQKASRVTGMSTYTGRFAYGSRTIQSRVRFIYSEPGTSISFLKDQFIDALGNDSVIIYLGHSRIGGGFPDFASPDADTGKIFKNDPIRGWIGFDKGYFSRTKYQIYMMSSCRTEQYYKNVLRARIWEKPPSMLGLILSTDDTWFDDYAGTAGAVISGLVNQFGPDDLLAAVNDAAEYYNSLHALDKDRHGQFMFDGVLDDAYAGKKPGKRISPNEPWHGFPM